MRHREHLKTTRAQQSVYAQSSDVAIVTASIREVIAALDEQITQVERKIRRQQQATPTKHLSWMWKFPAWRQRR